MKIWQEKDGHGKTVRDADGRARWCGDATIGGKRYRPRASSKKEIEDIFAALKVTARANKFGLLLPAEVETVTLIELAEKHTGALDLTLRQRRLEKRVIEDFVANLPAGLFVTELTTTDLSEYVRRIRRTSLGIKNDTINNKLKFVSKLLTAAPEYFAGLENWKRPRFPWLKRQKRGRERVIKKDEIAALLGALRAPKKPREQIVTHAARLMVADMFEVAVNTGMRWGEIKQLTVSQIDFERGYLQLPAAVTKTNEPRDVPLNARAMEVMRKYLPNAAPYLFTGTRENRPYEHYRRVLRRVAREARLEFGQDLPNGFTAHTTRHTATTNMLARSNDFATVQKIVGHSDATMTNRYAHANAENEKAIVAALIDD